MPSPWLVRQNGGSRAINFADQSKKEKQQHGKHQVHACVVWPSHNQDIRNCEHQASRQGEQLCAGTAAGLIHQPIYRQKKRQQQDSDIRKMGVRRSKHGGRKICRERQLLLLWVVNPGDHYCQNKNH